MSVRPLLNVWCLLHLVQAEPGLVLQALGVSERLAFHGLPILGCGRSLGDTTAGGAGWPAPAGLPILDRGRALPALAATVLVLTRLSVPVPEGSPLLPYLPLPLYLEDFLAKLTGFSLVAASSISVFLSLPLTDCSLSVLSVHTVLQMISRKFHSHFLLLGQVSNFSVLSLAKRFRLFSGCLPPNVFSQILQFSVF